MAHRELPGEKFAEAVKDFLATKMTGFQPVGKVERKQLTPFEAITQSMRIAAVNSGQHAILEVLDAASIGLAKFAAKGTRAEILLGQPTKTEIAAIQSLPRILAQYIQAFDLNIKKLGAEPELINAQEDCKSLLAAYNRTIGKTSPDLPPR